MVFFSFSGIGFLFAPGVTIRALAFRSCDTKVTLKIKLGIVQQWIPIKIYTFDLPYSSRSRDRILLEGVISAPDRKCSLRLLLFITLAD